MIDANDNTVMLQRRHARPARKLLLRQLDLFVANLAGDVGGESAVKISEDSLAAYGLLTTYDFDVDGTDVILTATPRSAAAIGVDLGTTENAGAALGAAASMLFSSDLPTKYAEMSTLFQELLEEGTTAEIKMAAEQQLHPSSHLDDRGDSETGSLVM